MTDLAGTANEKTLPETEAFGRGTRFFVTDVQKRAAKAFTALNSGGA